MNRAVFRAGLAEGAGLEAGSEGPGGRPPGGGVAPGSVLMLPPLDGNCEGELRNQLTVGSDPLAPDWRAASPDGAAVPEVPADGGPGVAAGPAGAAIAGLPGTLVDGGTSRGGVGATDGAAPAAPLGGAGIQLIRPEPVNPGPVPAGGRGGATGPMPGAGVAGLAPGELGDAGGAALTGAPPGGAANGGIRGGLVPGGAAAGKPPEDLTPEAAGLPPSNDC